MKANEVYEQGLQNSQPNRARRTSATWLAPSAQYSLLQDQFFFYCGQQRQFTLSLMVFYHFCRHHDCGCLIMWSLIAQQWEKAIVLRLGKFHGLRSAGFSGLSL